MKRKLYSISELISDNIRLKKHIEKMEINNAKNILWIISLFENGLPHNYDLDKLKRGFREIIEK